MEKDMENIYTIFNRLGKIFPLVIIVIMLSSGLNYSQVSNYISSVKTGDAKEKTALSITADLISSENISRISIAYKSFGQNEYQKLEMIIAGTSASVTIPSADILPPFIEYYLIVELRNGITETYPIDVEKGSAPIQLAISGKSEKDNEILVLSPFDGEMITVQNFLITISFFKAPDNIDIAKTKIFLNDQDISASRLLTDDLIIISSENVTEVPAGAKSLKVEVYDKEGKLYHSINKSFQVITERIAEQLASNWKYFGNLRAESRSESYNKASTWYNNINGEVNASYNDWRFNGYAYLTSEEKNNLQPFNRYAASIKNGDWLDLTIGDAYPRYPNLIMEGKRVRGFNGEVKLGAFNIQATYGETDRKVEGDIIQTYSASQVPLGSNIIAINQTKYGAPFAMVNLGTYSRSLFAVRPSFGSGENFQLGLTYLHSTDETNSIDLGARPQENALFGSDLMFAFDDQNIMFTSQAAISMFNRDISSGNLSDSQIDSLFGPGKYIDLDPSTVKDIRDIIGSFITVNQYIGPLNPQEFASLAAEAAMSLNYFNNSIKASYIYRGNDYQSFGQSFIRTDVKGINIVDRIRMFDNKVFVSLGYEDLQDNLQNTKIATTSYKTLSASVSIFPRTNFPNITLGYNSYNNSNGISINDVVNNRFMVDDKTNRFLINMSYDLVAGIRHSTSFSFSTVSRDDNSLANADASFNSGIIGVTSYWTSDLNSVFQIIYSSSEIKTIPYDYFTLVAGAKYRTLENKLLLSATLSPSFGDFNRQAFEVLADYNVLANFYLTFQARLFRFPGKTTNSIIGLTTRYTF